MKNVKRMLAVVLGMMFVATVNAAKPVLDNLPGIPVQNAEYWRAAQKEQSAQPEVSKGKQETFFYTGKPYEAEFGTYTFQFRSYDPELQRWTSADPSGFPDGPNNYFYAPIPNIELDPNGLISMTVENDVTKNKSFSGGFFGFAHFAGESRGSAGESSGSVSFDMAGNGKSWLGDLLDTVRATFSINIFVTAEGNLNYTTNGNYQSEDGSVKTGLSYEITGAGTKELTVRATGGWALGANSINGVGASGGASVSFIGTNHSESFAFGDWTFVE